MPRQKTIDKFNRSRAYLYIAGAVLFLYVVVTTSIAVVQLYDLRDYLGEQGSAQQINREKRTVEALESIRLEHKKTQDYVRCVAMVMLIQYEDRSVGDFDKCGVVLQRETIKEVRG